MVLNCFIGVDGLINFEGQFKKSGLYPASYSVKTNYMQ